MATLLAQTKAFKFGKKSLIDLIGGMADPEGTHRFLGLKVWKKTALLEGEKDTFWTLKGAKFFNDFKDAQIYGIKTTNGIQEAQIREIADSNKPEWRIVIEPLNLQEKLASEKQP